MKKIVVAFVSIFALIGMSIAIAQSDPVAVLRSVADQMIASLKKNKTTLKTNPGLVYSLAGRYIVPHADLTEMSKRVLPPKTWNSATSAQRSAFQKEFTTTLIRTYASAIAQYKDQTVDFFPIHGGYAGKSAVTVESQINSQDGPPISVTYRMISTGGGWKLYDLNVEGVSMLESFRSQFSDQLSHSNMADLIQVLKRHNHDNEQADANS